VGGVSIFIHTHDDRFKRLMILSHHLSPSFTYTYNRLRVRQCTVQLSLCPDFIARIPVYLNILKYFSAFPPIWLTAYASLGYTMNNLAQITAVLAAINSIYSFLVSGVQ